MLKYAILGTGGMANMHAERLMEIEGVELVCACDLDESRVNEFISKHDIPKAYTDFGKMLQEEDFTALSIVTPDPTHARLSLQAIAAGKHVLCEKPLATNAADAEKMVQAAKEAGVINMVNLSYRNSSAWQKANEMVQSGEIGTVRHFEGHYLQSWLSTKNWGDWKTSPQWLWRLSTHHGSNGVLGDLGVHLLDFALGPVGHAEKVFCHLKTFDKAPDNRIGEYVLDANDSALITIECSNGAAGSLSLTRWATGHQNSLALSIFGDKSALRIDLDDSYSKLKICPIFEDGTTGNWESMECQETPNMYQRFVDSVRTGIQDQPDFARGAEIQTVLDACGVSSQSQSMITLP